MSFKEDGDRCWHDVIFVGGDYNSTPFQCLGEGGRQQQHEDAINVVVASAPA